MLGKTLILGLISAGAAGGIVYYGTAPEGSEALEAHPHDGVKAEMPAKNARERIEPRLPTVRKAEDEDGRKKLASSAGLPAAAEVTPAGTAEVMPKEKTEAEPKKEMRWLDQYLKNNKSEASSAEAQQSEVEIEVTEIEASQDGGASDMAINSYTLNERAAINDIEPIDDIEPAAMPETSVSAEAKVTDQRTFRIENGQLVEINSDLDVTDPEDVAQMEEAQKTSEMHDKMIANKRAHTGSAYKGDKPKRVISRMSKSDRAQDSTPLLSTVMREAAAIEDMELRDQAYFEITEFALSEGRYESARKAHDLIKQDELSYTAKNRIAVAYAQNGQPTKAFKVISEVDEAELRDFMRLQIIEALIAPENLPQAWQEKAN